MLFTFPSFIHDFVHITREYMSHLQHTDDDGVLLAVNTTNVFIKRTHIARVPPPPTGLVPTCIESRPQGRNRS